MPLLIRGAFLLSALLLWAPAAHAHVQSGQAAGFLRRRPSDVGLDHVLAMIAVGLWGAQLGAPGLWLLPAPGQSALLYSVGFVVC